ncbi:hypothetical protein ES319_D11G375200v1 [Gossypium barbadense]|uniref:Secreted protein n=2 Tax=Gossypium TaxID=3633 RepID=A0A5J5PLV1_GOSBA|nr:hypothetical protein ES319_1Z178200v1 [Gossypium barbadense]KAB1671032.1 hypothetical protein [Gossypium barbadense]KAB2006833.1 hypothetical protein ES319_D11G375200v1 [Gossypium barbadense]TYH47283.1 hypothetical protein ES332_D11G400300v1 [Gossypium tomentosum]
MWRHFSPTSLAILFESTILLSIPATDSARSCIKSCILHVSPSHEYLSPTSWKKLLSTKSLKYPNPISSTD